MFIDCYKNNGKEYLRLCESLRKENNKGEKVSHKIPVLNIGFLNKFDDGSPEYLLRLRKSFKEGKPLIEILKPYCSKVPYLREYNFKYKEGDLACIGHPKLFSHMLIEKILEELGLMALFSSYKNLTKIQYDVYSFFKLMVFGRILSPASKQGTLRQNDDYYEPILDLKHNPDNIYDTLDFIADNHGKIIKRMNTNLVKKAKRNPEVIFYDVTNFYYEIETPDEDELDDDGEILVKGLRKNGVSKEKQKKPIVQMGLFMDDNGLPIAIETFPGNTLDHQTLKPALSKYIEDLDYSRFILIADRGVCTNYQNLLQVIGSGNGYIMAKSLLKSSKKEREWAYSDDGFIRESSKFKYKSKIIKRKVKDENGKEKELTEKVVIYWSQNFFNKACKENKLFLEFLEKVTKTPKSFNINKTQIKSFRKFLNKDLVNKNTGKVLSSSDLKAMIDFDKVDSYKKGFGFYQLTTSELTMPDKEVIEKYHGLNQIENQFRIMKGELSTKPLFVRSQDHIKAHLLISMIALCVIRIIQNKIVKSGLVKSAEEKNVSWTMGLSGERIQNALKKWQVEVLPGDFYKFMNTDELDLKLILDAFNVLIPSKFYRRAELKQLKTGINNFM